MSALRKLILDVMKPHEPSTIVYTDKLADLEGVNGVNTSMVEMDEEVVNIKVTLQGDDISFAGVREQVEDLGGSVHSVDRVFCGEEIVQDVRTPQD